MSISAGYFNVSEIPDYFPYECDKRYDSSSDILIYLGLVIFLGIGLVSHVFIIVSVLWTKRKTYKGSSFFQLFVMDSVGSLLIIMDEVLFTHLFLFVPSLCSTFSSFFFSPSVITKFVYMSMNHGRFMKSLAQICMVLNRMSCVVMVLPGRYELLWKKMAPICCVLISVLPFAGTWNVLISRVFTTSQRGGFALGYEKAVKWASMSMFQSSTLIVTFFFTITCTSITLYKLITLPGRIKSAEKSLCFTSISISVTFIIAVVPQFSIFFCSTCDVDRLYILQAVAFDTFTVGSAVLMILVNKNLRGSVFSGIKRVSIVSVS